eukprot:TRINITY_DN3049_c1_g1_i1.p1 TRINITY_DN3049_c1_g1~~TRINITY_DN3049_c1_g1_i1.p1  ORF type:complete len:141 (+),score=25.60 TRINITY_DN3049_c1_g1_i1:56-424(+)
MNVITWSLPFVSAKIMQSLLALLKVAEPGAQNADSAPRTIDAERREIIRNKIMAASKMLAMMQTLKEEHETIVKLKAIVPGNKIPQGLLLQGSDALQTAVLDGKKVRELDRINEKMPPKTET